MFVAERDAPRGPIPPGSAFLVRRAASDWTHLGIVVSSGPDAFDSIEGNTNDDGSREGFEACARTRGYADKDFIVWRQRRTPKMDGRSERDANPESPFPLCKLLKGLHHQNAAPGVLRRFLPVRRTGRQACSSRRLATKIRPVLALESAIPTSERDYALQLVLQSRTFARSDQLRAFLEYICALETEGRGDEIKEYAIAVEALGRPETFSATEDSIVRTRAHALRAKLEQLYAEELPDAPVRIELFKGSYRPHFISNEPKQPAVVSSGVAVNTPSLIRKLALCTLLGILLGAVGSWAIVKSTGSTLPAPSQLVAEAWGSLVTADSGRRILVAVASPLHLQILPRQTKPVERVSLEAPPIVYDWYSRYDGIRPDEKLYLFLRDGSTRFGDAMAASSVIRTVGMAGRDFEIMPERVVPTAMFQDRDVVLIGNPDFSARIARLLAKGRFDVKFDETTHLRTIVRLADKKVASKKIYAAKSMGDGVLTSFGLVSVFPGERFSRDDGGDGLHRTLVFSGSHSSCAVGAAEYFSSEVHLKKLKEKLRGEGYLTFPPSYQVLVRCTASGLVPLGVAYEAHSVLE